MIPNAENASATAAVGTASVNPLSRFAALILNGVHCKIPTLTTVKIVTSATSTVVTLSSRL